jgi:hypothetical protein
VLARIEDPEHWTTRANARSAKKRPVRPESPLACAWCISGAVDLETRALMLPYGHVSGYLYDAVPLVYPRHSSFVVLNDVEGHDAVLAVLRRAIDLAEAAS